MASSSTVLGPVELDQLNASNLSRAWVGEPPDKRSVEYVRTLADPALLAVTLLPFVVYELCEGEVTRAEGVLGEIRALGLEMASMPDEFVWAYHLCRGYSELQGLRYASSLDNLAMCAAVVERTGNALWASISAFTFGRVHCRRGDLAEAIEVLSHVTNQEDSDFNLLLVGRAHLSEIFAHQGNVEEALEHVTKFLEHGSLLRSMDRNYFTASRARLLTANGELGQASHAIDAVLPKVLSEGNRFQSAVLELAQSVVALERGQLVTAEELSGRALGKLAASGNTYEELDAQAVHAKCLHALGKAGQATALLEDPRREFLGPWRRAQTARLRARWAREAGEWEAAVYFQNEVLRFDADTSRQLPDLYGLLAGYRHRRDLEDQRIKLERTNKVLGAAQTQKDELMAIVAHDLRSPLAALQLSLEAAGSGVDDSLSGSRLAVARRTVGRVRNVTQRLERLQEIESQVSDLSVSVVDVRAVVLYVCQQHEATARTKNIRLRVVQSDLRVVLYTDEEKLTQILENLVSNALKYSNEAGLVTVRVSTSPSGRRLRISVSDTGLGLSAEDQTEIFTKYGRLSSRPTGAESSFGIGLYIAYSLAKSIDSHLSATSEGKGFGSDFVLSVPLGQWDTR